ncbi:MAG: hypothetical protein KatS3mg105_4369 [Gemmatales bacterium]|nr:MAG: hypothetical protein KatS3mg105_4369 [Gemmatales bacterium]
MLFRNPLDLWPDAIKKSYWWQRHQAACERLDQWTKRYENFCGNEQGWNMFSPPMARGAPFMTARIRFTDGSTAEVRSENELGTTGFFRIGGWRQRKLEDYMVFEEPDELASDEELPLFEAYARWSVQRWRQQAPHDSRTPQSVTLFRRRIPFPKQSDWHPPTESEIETTLIGEFRADGTLRR